MKGLEDVPCYISEGGVSDNLDSSQVHGCGSKSNNRPPSECAARAFRTCGPAAHARTLSDALSGLGIEGPAAALFVVLRKLRVGEGSASNRKPLFGLVPVGEPLSSTQMCVLAVMCRGFVLKDSVL